ncbi:MAG: hypothetical protein NTU88_09310, partial [Armatimonadetes bacterium]|nr:hypothetical protein [Armatimonadota bacterium]
MAWRAASNQVHLTSRRQLGEGISPHLPNVLREHANLRVVRLVCGDGFWLDLYGSHNAKASTLEANRQPAATGEEIHRSND